MRFWKILNEPLDKNSFRTISSIGLLGLFMGAVLFAIAIPKWEYILIGIALSIPGALLSGALMVFCNKFRKQ
jgi:hypothetical protein